MRLKSIYEDLNFQGNRPVATQSQAATNSELEDNMDELDLFLKQQEQEADQAQKKRQQLLDPRLQAIGATSQDLSTQVQDLSKISQALGN